MIQAALPRGMADADKSIASMDIGASGWTVPWAMFHDKERRLWLNGSHTIDDEPGGTAMMFIRHEHDGWHVDASRVPGYTRWGMENYAGDFTAIPVATANFFPWRESQ